MKKLFVGGLAWGTTDDSLRDAFAAQGREHQRLPPNTRNTVKTVPTYCVTTIIK